MLTVLAIFGLLAYAAATVLRFWHRVTTMLEHDEQSVYGESLASWK